MTMEELHDRLFDVLCVVDDICREESIRYFLDSGTLIGAAREKNFIPWDDDADIKVLAEDYPAFKRAMEENLPEYMHIVEPEVFAPYWYDFTIRIYDERYLMRPRNEEDDCYNNYNNHVGTDVFIFNRVNDSFLRKKCMLFYSKVLYGMGMAHRYGIDFEKYTNVQKTEILVLRGLGKFFSAKRICNMWKKFILRQRHCKKPCRFSGNYTLSGMNFFAEHIYSEIKYLSIRGREFPAPIGYDEELRQIYGDYMKPVHNREIYRTHI